MPDIFTAYLITFGWAIAGSVAMGVGIIVALKLFDLSTRGIDEWQLIKEGNIPMAIVLASVIVSLGIVVSAVACSPKSDPDVMRVIAAREGKETLDVNEAKEAA